ncbi:tetratricopeptide repeat protein [Nafulsella turpanensis]|uniref:tetratricopeptide repeat protein n=1 Tax=Nafulsella turpanensis TaxID=1265690 RepID=UPI000366A254|nr:tetratricopeptide repeat protein [Nafulsella turpanensis]
MKYLLQIAWLVLLSAGLSSCGQEVSRDEIHELPHLNAGFYQQALVALDEEIENYPRNADAFFKKAVVLEQLGQPDNAILQYKNAIKFDSLNASYFKGLARVFAKQDKLGRAEENALKAVQLGDQTAELHQLLALIYNKKGEHTVALSYLNKALESSPSNSNYVFRKGRLYLQLSDTARAREFILANLPKIEAGPEVYEALADISVADKKYGEAVAYLDSSLHLLKKPEVSLLAKKADVLLRAGKEDQAKNMLNSYLQQDSVNFALNYKLAELHYKSYTYDSALYFLNRALKIEAQSKEAFLLMGQVYDRKRMYYTARDQFKNALLIDTSYQEAQKALGELEQKLAYIYRKQQEAKEESLPQPVMIEPKLRNQKF